MDWNKEIERAHHTAVEHGFWEHEASYEHQAMLVITELSEAIDADRHDRHADKKKYEDMRVIIDKSVLGFKERLYKRKKAFEMCIKDTVEDELADACIRLMDLLGDYGHSDIDERDYAVITDTTLCDFCFRVTGMLVTLQRGACACRNALELILVYAHQKNIDIEWHILEKMAYNEQRPRLNGKSY